MCIKSSYLHSNRRLRYDYQLGLRGWGLVIYGVLPASLATLGARVPILPGESRELVFALAVLGVAPLAVLYLLIRQRLAHWYLSPDYLGSRSAVTTALIFLLSSAVCGAAGLANGEYVILPARQWLSLGPDGPWPAIGKSSLLGLVVLVGSSTLFLIAVKDVGGLPALPSKQFVERLRSLRDALIFEWLGLDWDAGPVTQSDDLDVYTRAMERLALSGHAYACAMTRGEILESLRAPQQGSHEMCFHDSQCP